MHGCIVSIYKYISYEECIFIIIIIEILEITNFDWHKLVPLSSEVDIGAGMQLWTCISVFSPSRVEIGVSGLWAFMRYSLLIAPYRSGYGVANNRIRRVGERENPHTPHCIRCTFPIHSPSANWRIDRRGRWLEIRLVYAEAEKMKSQNSLAISAS